MECQYKNINSFGEGRKKRRGAQTEPVEPTGQLDQRELDAKLCLIELNKEEEPHYHPFLERKQDKANGDLSQWHLEDSKATLESQKKPTPFHRVRKRSEKRSQEKRPKLQETDLLNNIQKSLIQSTDSRLSCRREKRNLTEMVHVRSLNRNQHYTPKVQTYDESFDEPMSDIHVTITRIPKQSMYVKQIQLMRRKKPEKTEENTPIPPVQCTTDRYSQEKERLPRLQRQQYSNKYRCAFRSINPMKYSMPLQTALSREIERINKLIGEENIKMIQPIKK